MEELATTTRDCYRVGIEKFRDYMYWVGRSPREATPEDLAAWIAYESLFLSTGGVSKYASAVSKFLKLGKGKEGGELVHGGISGSVKTGVFKRYGLPIKDDRVPVTIKLLCDISKNVPRGQLNDVCMMAASIIGFIGCLRCGEFTVPRQNTKNYLRVRDWKCDNGRAQIFLAKSKTDQYGRGHYVKLKSLIGPIDPIIWMQRLFRLRKSSQLNDPLFVLDDGKILSRTTLIAWLRMNAKAVGFASWKKLNGISYRRGAAQYLRDQGYPIEKLSRWGRWRHESSALHYIEPSDAILDEFAAVFQKGISLAEEGKVWGDKKGRLDDGKVWGSKKGS